MLNNISKTFLILFLISSCIPKSTDESGDSNNSGASSSDSAHSPLFNFTFPYSTEETLVITGANNALLSGGCSGGRTISLKSPLEDAVLATTECSEGQWSLEAIDIPALGHGDSSQTTLQLEIRFGDTVEVVDFDVVYNRSGAFSLSFAENGYLIKDGSTNDRRFIAAKLDGEGFIYVAEVEVDSGPVSNLRVYRFLKDGTIDTTFSSPILDTSTANFVTASFVFLKNSNEQTVNVFLLVTESITTRFQKIFKLQPNGVKDSTFNSNSGELVLSPSSNSRYSSPLYHDADRSRMILAIDSIDGSTKREVFIHSILYDGSLESSFGSSGVRTIEAAVSTNLHRRKLYVDANGIILYGYATPGGQIQKTTLQLDGSDTTPAYSQEFSLGRYDRPDFVVEGLDSSNSEVCVFGTADRYTGNGSWKAGYTRLDRSTMTAVGEFASDGYKTIPADGSAQVLSCGEVINGRIYCFGFHTDATFSNTPQFYYVIHGFEAETCELDQTFGDRGMVRLAELDVPLPVLEGFSADSEFAIAYGHVVEDGSSRVIPFISVSKVFD